MKNPLSIYFDYQSTTPLNPEVLKKMQPFLGENFANPHSADHAMGWESAQTLEKAAYSVAQFIGCEADEVIFTSGATEANNLAIFGVGRGRFTVKRNRILISAIEHKCVIEASYALARQSNLRVEVLPVNENGTVILSALKDMIDDDVRLVSVMAVNNEIGTLQDIAAIGQITRDHGALLHCDAAQAPSAMNLPDIFAAADMLSLSAHKLYGPKGIGALAIRRELHDRIEPLIYGGEQQNGLRAGTVPLALCVGLSAALSEFSAAGSIEVQTVRRLRDTFAKELFRRLPGLALNGPSLDKRHPGNLNISLPSQDGADFLNRLQPGLAASTGAACASGAIAPSHVLKAIGLSDKRANKSVRFSLGLGSTLEDVSRALDLIESAYRP